MFLPLLIAIKSKWKYFALYPIYKTCILQHVKHRFIFFQFYRNIEILVGTVNLKSGGTRYSVEKFIPHEQYDKPQFANDIALVRVKGKIAFNDKVKPIKYSSRFIEDGAFLEAFGWGKLKVS